MKQAQTQDTDRPWKWFDFTKHQLLLAVMAIFLVLAYLLYSGYSDVKTIYNETSSTIIEQQQKLQLLTGMANVARERSLILLKMLAEDDPFVVDELAQEFSQQALIYILNRQKLLDMQLTEAERRLLAGQDKLAGDNQILQNRVAELLQDGQREQAKQVLMQQAIPGQNGVLKQINRTIEEYNKNTIELVDAIRKNFQAYSRRFMALAVLLLIVSVIVVLVIITRASRAEQRKLQQALDNLAEQKHALDAHAIVSITDLQGNITYANAQFCASSGYSESELLGKNLRMLDSGKHDKAFFDDMYRRIAAGDIWKGEICNRAKDGHEYWLETTIVPSLGEDGKPQSYISMCSDVTERKQTEKALRRAQKMEAVGQLTGGIAHDFNNILGVVLGNLSLLEHQLPADEKIRKRLDSINRATQRAIDLTRQLLGFSSKQQGATAVTDINHLIEEMQSLIARAITPQVAIRHEFAPNLWLTEINPGDFQDSLINLILNARDAMQGQGEIVLRTANVTLDSAYCAVNPGSTPGDYVQVSIEDSGCGIEAEQLDRIFEPFFTTKPQGKGTGLGLAMVFGFIKRSGGHIRVQSEPGAGTCFELYLPRSMQHEASQAQPEDASNPAEAPAASSGGGATILVVDDEQDLLELASETLRAQGYRALTAANGEQALQILSQHDEIQLLLTDIVMPGRINGYELAEQARQCRPGVSILLTSGYTEKVSKNDAASRDQTDLLKKPYQPAELIRRVRRALADAPKSAVG